MVINNYKWNTKLDIVYVKKVHEMGLMDITEKLGKFLSTTTQQYLHKKNKPHYHPSWDNHDHTC